MCSMDICSTFHRFMIKLVSFLFVLTICVISMYLLYAKLGVSMDMTVLGIISVIKIIIKFYYSVENWLFLFIDRNIVL